MKLKKLLIGTLLSTAVALTLQTLSGCELLNFGVETAYAETSGDWEYSITDSEAKTASITKYAGDKVNITIPAEIDGYAITGISDMAFKSSRKIKSVVISEGVTSIGNMAFFDCSSMKNITIPDTMISIGQQAFSDCISMESIYIPANVTSIGRLAFDNCMEVDSIVVDEENTVYDSRNNCNAIIETSTDTLVRASNNTVIPQDIVNLAGRSFKGLSGLESIIIPNSVKNVGYGDFSYCANLKSVTLSNQMVSLGGEMFLECTGLTSITIPSNITNIESAAFSGCTSLVNVDIKGDVTIIESSAFNNCKSLESITIPSNVTKIGNYVFENCKSLESITIPSKVTEIGGSVFYGCVSLTSIVVEDDNTVYDSRDNCNAIIKTATNELLYGCNNTVIPNTVTSIYRNAFYQSGITNITIPGTVTSIGDYAFYQCNELTKVTLHEGIESIGDFAFMACENLAEITIPSSVTSIGTGAFRGCKGLTSIEVTEGNTVYNSINDCNAIIETATNKLLYGCKNTVISDGVVSIANRAFYECEGLTSISIPASVTSIDRDSFEGCVGIASIVVSEDNTVYDSRDNCNAIIETGSNKLFIGCKNTVIPSTVKTIGMYAFRGCGLTSIEIPDNITAIEGYAFYKCNNLTEIYIPASVTSMGKYVFRECSELREIVVDEANTVYNSSGNCNAIIETATNKLILGCVNTEIPNTVTSIGSYAFDHCENVGKIVIPDSVVSIEQFAFYYCSNIVIEMVSDITDINKDAFYNNENILIHCLPDSNLEANVIYNGIEYKYIINGAVITLEPKSVVYNGTSKVPSVKLVAGETILEEGTDYEVSYSDNINAGTATVTITGIGNCVGKIETTFEIEAAEITEATLGTVTYTYDGEAKTPSVVVKCGEATLEEGTDYTVTFSNNTNAGTGTVTVNGKGNYAGTITKTFTIKEVPKPAVTKPTVTKPTKVSGLKQLTSYAMKYIKLSWAKVSDAKGYEIYRATSKNGTYKLIKTTTKTSFKNEKLAVGKNYFYKVRAYKVVDGKKVYGDFSSVKKMITKSKAPVINAKRTTKTKAKLTWKKVTGAEGYEVYMKTGKNGKYKKVTTLNAKKVAYTKAKLKKGTKYSFKLRTYRKVGNKKIYSDWSKVKSV